MVSVLVLESANHQRYQVRHPPNTKYSTLAPNVCAKAPFIKAQKPPNVAIPESGVASTDSWRTLIGYPEFFNVSEVILDAVAFDEYACNASISGIHVDSYDWFKVSNKSVPGKSRIEVRLTMDETVFAVVLSRSVVQVGLNRVGEM
jgi:hypothetical protein